MHTETRAFNWPMLLGAFALVAGAIAARALFNAPTDPLLADTDDAMRLVVVRDFLAGQGWYDHIQHRLNTPFGAEIHWSRLADLPIAGLILLFSPLGQGMAELVAVWAWPLILLFALLLLSGRLSVALVGPKGQFPGMILPALAVSVLPEFAPGRIDHHSLQVLLTLAMAWCAVEAVTRSRFGYGVGLAAVTSLAIGTEGLPSVVAAILAMAILWVLLPGRGAALRNFGLAFAIGGAVHLAIALPPSRWLEVACDAYSGVFAAAAMLTGSAVVALSLLPLGERRPLVRLAVGALVGGIVIAALLLAFPECLRGPYAGLDPWLVEHWLARITEAKPVWTSIEGLPGFTVGITVPVLLAVLVTGWRLLRGPRAGRAQWFVYAGFLLMATVVTIVQVRGARLAGPLAVPAGAWLIVVARERYLARTSLARTIGLVGAWLGFAGIAITVAANAAFGAAGMQANGGTGGDRRACLMPPAFAELAALPPERLMTPIDLGSHMLLETPHAVVAAPYHRNQQGVRDAFAFFNGPIDAARDILERRGVSLVVVCPAMPELRGIDPAPDSFVKLLAAGALPGWLVESTLPDAPLRVFAVLPR